VDPCDDLDRDGQSDDPRATRLRCQGEESARRDSDRDAAIYDALSHRFLLPSPFERIGADVAAIATDGARLLEVGCGPGRPSIQLARRYGLDATGLDLDQSGASRGKRTTQRRTRMDALVGDRLERSARGSLGFVTLKTSGSTGKEINQSRQPR
jgi:SAM-dependent methyltransferase